MEAFKKPEYLQTELSMTSVTTDQWYFLYCFQVMRVKYLLTAQASHLEQILKFWLWDTGEVVGALWFPAINRAVHNHLVKREDMLYLVQMST